MEQPSHYLVPVPVPVLVPAGFKNLDGDVCFTAVSRTGSRLLTITFNNKEEKMHF